MQMWANSYIILCKFALMNRKKSDKRNVRSIKRKVGAGFTVLAFILFFSSIVSLFEYTRMNRVLTQQIEENVNSVNLIGRLTRDPEFQKYEGKSKCRICIAVKRPFKNSDGIFEVDYITWNVWNVIAIRDVWTGNIGNRMSKDIGNSYRV